MAPIPKNTPQNALTDEFGLGDAFFQIQKAPNFYQNSQGMFGQSILAGLGITHLAYGDDPRIAEMGRKAFEKFEEFRKDFDSEYLRLVSKYSPSSIDEKMELAAKAFRIVVEKRHIRYAPTSNPAAATAMDYDDCDLLTHKFVQLAAKHGLIAQAALFMPQGQEEGHCQVIYFGEDGKARFIRSEFLVENRLSPIPVSAAAIEKVGRNEIFGMESSKVDHIFGASENPFVDSYKEDRELMPTSPEDVKTWFRQKYGFENERIAYEKNELTAAAKQVKKNKASNGQKESDVDMFTELLGVELAQKLKPVEAQLQQIFDKHHAQNPQWDDHPAKRPDWIGRMGFSGLGIGSVDIESESIERPDGTVSAILAHSIQSDASGKGFVRISDKQQDPAYRAYLDEAYQYLLPQIAALTGKNYSYEWGEKDGHYYALFKPADRVNHALKPKKVAKQAENEARAKTTWITQYEVKSTPLDVQGARVVLIQDLSRSGEVNDPHIERLITHMSGGFSPLKKDKKNSVQVWDLSRYYDIRLGSLMTEIKEGRLPDHSQVIFAGDGDALLEHVPSARQIAEFSGLAKQHDIKVHFLYYENENTMGVARKFYHARIQREKGHDEKAVQMEKEAEQTLEKRAERREVYQKLAEETGGTFIDLPEIGQLGVDEVLKLNTSDATMKMLDAQIVKPVSGEVRQFPAMEVSLGFDQNSGRIFLQEPYTEENAAVLRFNLDQGGQRTVCELIRDDSDGKMVLVDEKTLKPIDAAKRMPKNHDSIWIGVAGLTRTGKPFEHSTYVLNIKRDDERQKPQAALKPEEEREIQQLIKRPVTISLFVDQSESLGMYNQTIGTTFKTIYDRLQGEKNARCEEQKMKPDESRIDLDNYIATIQSELQAIENTMSRNPQDGAREHHIFLAGDGGNRELERNTADDIVRKCKKLGVRIHFIYVSPKLQNTRNYEIGALAERTGGAVIDANKMVWDIMGHDEKALEELRMSILKTVNETQINTISKK